MWMELTVLNGKQVYNKSQNCNGAVGTGFLLLHNTQKEFQCIKKLIDIQGLGQSDYIIKDMMRSANITVEVFHIQRYFLMC